MQPAGAPPASTYIDARPAALVNGRSVTWGELRAALSEAAGAQALEELILDRALEQALTEQAISVSEDDIAAERVRLLRSLNEDPDVALRLLEELRARQGLGPVRFHSLLKRNASLRALVRERVAVSEESIRRLFEVHHGPKRQARLIVVPSLDAAERAADRIEAAEPFFDVAVDASTDSSAARGGLLEPISRRDPAYPDALRQALWRLGVGEVSPPVLLDDRYALLQLVREIEADGVTLEEARDELASLVRLNQERLLMDQLALRLLADTSVTIFDDALHDSWRRRRER